MKMTADEAFVTLATTNYYCKGATVVAKSLRRYGTTRKIVVMVTPNVSKQSRLGLERVFDEVMVVDVMDSKDHLHLALLARPDLGVTFTKIHCWTLTQFRKCVFLDADTLVLSNVDELFERDEFSAAPDPGWPDCFNSGVFVFKPSLHTHGQLLDHALEYGSFDGGDQGLLNSFFSTWPLADISRHLPFIYNLSASSVYTYLPAFQQFGHKAKIVHFIGATKPWNTRSQTDECDSNTMEHFLGLWWREFYGDLPPTPPPELPSKPRDEPPQVPTIQEDKAKTPLRQSVERPSAPPSLPTQEEPRPAPQPRIPPRLQPMLQPKMVFTVVKEAVAPKVTLSSQVFTSLKEAIVPKVTLSSQPPLMDLKVSVEVSSPREAPQIQDLPPEAEITEDVESEETDTEPLSAEEREREQLERRALWETGKADYLGRDAFLNIQKMLDCFLE